MHQTGLPHSLMPAKDVSGLYIRFCWRIWTVPRVFPCRELREKLFTSTINLNFLYARKGFKSSC